MLFLSDWLFFRISYLYMCLHREMEEITTFIKGAICDDQCLGRCMYIHGVPGTGKVK